MYGPRMDLSKCAVVVISSDGSPAEMSPAALKALVAAKESESRYRGYVDKLGSDLFTVLVLAVLGMRAENVLLGVLAGSMFSAAMRGLAARRARRDFELASRP